MIQQFNERNAPVFLISLKPAASGWTSNLFASVVDDGNAFGSVPTVDDIRGLRLSGPERVKAGATCTPSTTRNSASELPTVTTHRT
ncbi:hypothetical protein [Mycobacterium tuberculosis]|uniref:hypothetical protein n=1 Tax=Mycobacterium tuberculosis TaxID=1773 RepID=UPI0004AC8B3F|nr:hypothetical protein [Mycobacterium tuberculosis]